LHLLDTYAGLILPLDRVRYRPHCCFRQFFMTVPEELLEASRIDGAGPFRFFKDTPIAPVGGRRSPRCS